MSISLRQRWNEHGGLHPLSQGVKGGSVVYKGKMAEAFPFDSMRALANSLKWPSRVVPTRNFPHDSPKAYKLDWFSTRNQGVAHDDKFFYFATVTTLIRVPRTLPFPHELLIENVALKRKHLFDEGIADRLINFHHFGDPDFHDGLLYVPVEGKNAPHPVVMAFDRELEFMGWAPLLDMAGPGNFPWLAIRNGLLYTSGYNDNGVRVYKLPTIAKFSGLDRNGMSLRGVPATEAVTRAEPVGDDAATAGPKEEIGLRPLGKIFFTSLPAPAPLPAPGVQAWPLPGSWFEKAGGPRIIPVVKRLQGGATTSNGHLWLVSWQDRNQLLGIDLLTGRFRSTGEVQVNVAQEPEGITAVDLGEAGQLHMVLLDNTPNNTTSVYLKHYESEGPENRSFV